MWAKPADIEQHTQRLLRVVEPPIFRFIVVQAMPQFAAADAFAAALSAAFPDRPMHRVKVENQDYRALMRDTEAVESGFVLLENFERTLENPDVYVGFNQRRDRVAARPVALIIFLPTGAQPARTLQDRIPDFWSFRAHTFEIKYRAVPDLYPVYEPELREQLVHGLARFEIGRLQDLIEETPPEEGYLRASYLLQQAEHFAGLFLWPQALAAQDEALSLLQALPQDGSVIALTFDALYLKAILHEDQEAYFEALVVLEKAMKLAEKNQDWERTAKCLNEQGSVLLKQGELDEAWLRFERALDILTEKARGANVLKAIATASLGVTRRKMGEVDSAQAYLKKAFEELGAGWRGVYVFFALDAHLSLIERAAEQGYAPSLHTDHRVVNENTPYYRLFLGSLKAKAGFHHSAVDNSDWAISRWIRKDEVEHPLLAECYLTKALGLMNTVGLFHTEERLAQYRQNTKPQIEALLDKVEQIYQQFYPNSPNKLLYPRLLRSHLYSEFGTTEQAVVELRSLISELENQPRPNPAMLAKCCAMYSLALGRQEQWEEAREYADKAELWSKDLIGLPEFEVNYIHRARWKAQAPPPPKPLSFFQKLARFFRLS